FHFLPRHTGFTGIAFDRAAKLDQIFHVFDTLLKPEHLRPQRLQGWFLRFSGSFTHMLSFDPLRTYTATASAVIDSRYRRFDSRPTSTRAWTRVKDLTNQLLR